MRRAASFFLLILYGHCTFDLGQCSQCDPSRCRLENNCLCMSTHPPGNLTAAEMPQLVMLTFDDTVNEQNMGFYRELLAPGKRRNLANGCNVAATFFMSAGYTVYPFVHELHSAGNEIALHSITHLDNLTYWRTLDVAGWEAEFVGVRHLLRDYALIPEEDMVGARAPFLEIGPGSGYAMMQKHGFLYDSSVYVRQNEFPQFPYTLDYGVRGCENIICPSGAFNGLWLVPMNMFVLSTLADNGTRVECFGSMPDWCRPQPNTTPDMFNYLRTNFERFYQTNRAPFPLFIHENWLWEPERKKGYLSFIDWLLTKKDVFLVTIQEVVNFMQDPKPLGNYSQKICSRATEFRHCPEVHTCNFPQSSIPETKYLFGCRPCPSKYPWIDDVKLEGTSDHAKPTSADQSYGAVSVVLCFVLLFFICVAAKLSIPMFASGRRKNSHIL